MSYISELKELCAVLGCNLLENEPLKNHVSFRTGGSCRALISVNSIETIIKVTQFCKDKNIKYTVLGKGSNVIVSDKGFDGIVLLMGNDFSEIKVSDDSTVSCQAGASLSAVCIKALENNLSGMEFAYGIPGSVGGAVFMNAGAYGGEIKDVIVSAEYIDNNGEVKTIDKENMNLSYRHSIFSDRTGIITGAVFKLNNGNHDEINNRMNELMSKRKEKQPLEYPSAGSTFKRPEGAYAAALIEQCGLKGYSIGGAEVSSKHSGFVINKNNASTEDILNLIKYVQKKVKDETGFILETEPEFIE